MDLYTPSFGKLQKQLQDDIAKASRNKQKQIDESNGLLRKNMGKNAVDMSYQSLIKEIRNTNRSIGANSGGSSSSSSPPPSRIVVTAGNAGGHTVYSSAMLSTENFEDIAQNLSENSTHMNKEYYNSVCAGMEELMTPASMEPFHPNMNYSVVANTKALSYAYEEVDGHTLSKVTYWS
jgi:hypothetical protein